MRLRLARHPNRLDAPHEIIIQELLELEESGKQVAVKTTLEMLADLHQSGASSRYAGKLKGTPPSSLREFEMKRTKTQTQRDLNLAQLPDDAFMHLLEEVGDSDIVDGPSLKGIPVFSPEEISRAVVNGSVGNLLAEARSEAGRSLADIGSKGGVSRARIQQIERSENIEVATLVRVASACGYDVAITLRPVDAKKRQLTTVLAG